MLGHFRCPLQVIRRRREKCDGVPSLGPPEARTLVALIFYGVNDPFLDLPEHEITVIFEQD